MTSKDDTKPRSFFRLEYPDEVRPRILIDDESYPIINLSEGGVKLKVMKSNELNTEKELNGTILFHNADQTEVIGKIIRKEKDAVVLQLSEGVPLQKIMTQQRFLLNKYGTLRRPRNS